ncbi:hypothetical protein K9L97_01155 [Candidatus Woesearchaeota archaeon]|nr:hypothetical protein [Candidatus Woesearchaeota archaeon]
MNRLDNFKGKIHKLTKDDCIRGGKVSSERKRKANGIKNLLHGRNSDKLFFLLSCIDCPAIGRCEKSHDGYCTYLLEEMKLNRDFSKQVARCLHVDKEGLDPTTFLMKKYELNKEYIAMLFPSDSNG